MSAARFPTTDPVRPGANDGGPVGAEPWLLLGRAFGGASGIVLAVAGGAGVVLFAATAALPAEALPYYGLGVAVALIAGMLAMFVHGRFLDPRAAAPFSRDGRLLAGRLQSLLAAAFGIKLAALVVVMLVLRQLGAKFADTATFGITFAAAALLVQVSTAALLARALRRNQRAGGALAASNRPTPNP